MSKVGKIRARLIELWRRETPYKTTDNIFWNGEDNNYSEEIERVVQASPTGVRASTMMSKFIFGGGISEIDDVEFPNGVLLSEVVKDVVDDVALQSGAFIHVSYGINEKGEFAPAILKSLDYNKCRISKPDDEGNEGMIMVKNFNKFDPSVPREKQNVSSLFYPFSDNQNVIKSQIKADAKKKKVDSEDWTELIQHYRGQVLYINLTPKYRYALSKFDSVYNDLDSEARISTYINTMVRKGFIGKTAILTQGLDDEQSEQIYEDVAEWLGSENASQVYHVNVEQASDLSQVLRIEQVKSQFDYQQFDQALNTIRRNILGAANNLPEGLAFSDQGALFAGSGESYRQMKQFYWEQNSWEREKIETAFWKMGFEFNFLDFDGNEKVATDEVEASPEASEETLKAQASLRGSVGGVQGILGVQQSVSQGLTDFESAITILMEIYGFNRTVSAALLGKPEIEETTNSESDGNITE